MFSSISWQTYLVTLSGLCFIYYLSILLWFYRKELWQFLSNNPQSEFQEELAEAHSVIGQAKSTSHPMSSEELHFDEPRSISNKQNPTNDED